MSEICESKAEKREPPVPLELRPLTAEKRACLTAAAARLIPSNDGPGALETGVVDYIEGALRSRTHRHFLPLLERGLDLLDYLAGESTTRTFAECSVDDQDEILLQAQSFPNNEARKFFSYFLDLAIEGFLCDPVHGGNRGRLGWAFVGFEDREPGICKPGGKR